MKKRKINLSFLEKTEPKINYRLYQHVSIHAKNWMPPQKSGGRSVHSWFECPWCVLTHCAKAEQMQGTHSGTALAILYRLRGSGWKLQPRSHCQFNTWEILWISWSLPVPLSVIAGGEPHACCFAAGWLAQGCWKAVEDTDSQWGHLI